MKYKIAALIPARGGSKGIPNKNLSIIDSLPMIAYTILAALKVEKIDKVFVSSDSSEILATAELYGATPLLRPDELAKDTSSTESVISHFLTKVSCLDVVLIQPTSPMLLPNDLEDGLRVYFDKENKVDSVFSAVKANDILVWDGDSIYPINYNPKKRGNRQNRKQITLIENGAFYIFSKRRFLATNCRLNGRIGYSKMPYWRSFQVDNRHDLNSIRTLMTMKG